MRTPDRAPASVVRTMRPTSVCSGTRCWWPVGAAAAPVEGAGEGELAGGVDVARAAPAPLRGEVLATAPCGLPEGTPCGDPRDPPPQPARIATSTSSAAPRRAV